MRHFRVMALAAVPLVLGLALAGCADAGDDSMPGMDHGGGMTASASPSVEAQGDFSAADSMFAMMMIPHHEQAVEMSDMILAKSGVDPRVSAIAQQIKDAQGPEIELMQSWLDDEGAPSTDGMDGMDHGDGMMSDEDMAALENAGGAEAARLFLEQMIVHHEGAIEMAQSELDSGSHPDALALAQAISETQTVEIGTMQDLLAQI